MSDFTNRLQIIGFNLNLSTEAKNFIAEKGYDRNFGARPLKRAIQKYLEDELAEMMLRLTSEGKTSGEITVAYAEGDDKLALAFKETEPAVEKDIPEEKDTPEEKESTEEK